MSENAHLATSGRNAMTSARLRIWALIVVAMGFFSFTLVAAPMKPEMSVGEKVKDFTLKDLDDQEVTLSKLTAKGPVVLVVLRGYPGYQCPICLKQFGSVLGKASEFAEAGAQILFVYPGEAKDLAQHAQDFVGKTEFPENVHFVIDPDYKFTNLYGLRWDAPHETAYPTSLVVGKDLTIKYVIISENHGGRANTADLLKAVK